MSLIDYQYFINDINVPDLGDFDNLDDYIDRYEKDFLINAFGYTLYKLIAAYNASTSPQRIKDIVEGKEFDYNDRTYKWPGLIDTDNFISPISYYVFYHRTRENRTYTSTTNELQTTHNYASVAEGGKMMRAWNSMCEMMGSYNGSNYYNSLYFFMSYNLSTYPEWEFNSDKFQPQNSFDI